VDDVMSSLQLCVLTLTLKPYLIESWGLKMWSHCVHI